MSAHATQFAWRAGLRAHELLTLQRITEAEGSGHRQWSEERFQGREGERYIVTGQGGLRRELLIPAEHVLRLLASRFAASRIVTDRRIHYCQHYAIGGGNASSKSFSDSAIRTLGWSHGTHGLRHSYAPERMQELQASGLSYYPARDVVTQELRHFRGGYCGDLSALILIDLINTPGDCTGRIVAAISATRPERGPPRCIFPAVAGAAQHPSRAAGLGRGPQVVANLTALRSCLNSIRDTLPIAFISTTYAQRS